MLAQSPDGIEPSCGDQPPAPAAGNDQVEADPGVEPGKLVRNRRGASLPTRVSLRGFGILGRDVEHRAQVRRIQLSAPWACRESNPDRELMRPLLVRRATSPLRAG